MNNQNNEYFVCPNCGKAVQPGLEKCENCAIDVASLKKKKPEVTESANQDSPEENAIPTGSTENVKGLTKLEKPDQPEESRIFAFQELKTQFEALEKQNPWNGLFLALVWVFLLVSFFLN